tara:strand:+ start:2074 stop:2319 length:246 start_codon:yes stop_codon:yes gene_type:complete
MGFVEDMMSGLAFVISPTTYMITKKAEQGKLKHTGEQLGKGFVKGITLGQVDLTKKKNGNGNGNRRKMNGNGNGKKNGKKK